MANYFGKPSLGQIPKRTDVLMKGLLGWWIMNEGRGNKTYDTSGNGNTGTLANVAQSSTNGWSGGKYGHALIFNGATSYVDLGARSAIAAAFAANIYTVSFWVNYTFSSAIHRGWAFQRSSPGFLGCNFNETNGNLTAGALSFYSGNGAGVNGLASDTRLVNTGTWRHIVNGCNGATQFIYIDGTFESSRTIPAGSGGAATNFTIGDLSPGGASIPFNGSQDDYRIYNYLLKPREIQDLYTNPYRMFNTNTYHWFVPLSTYRSHRLLVGVGI